MRALGPFTAFCGITMVCALLACGDSGGTSGTGTGGGGTGGGATTTVGSGGSGGSTGTSMLTCTGEADPGLQCMAPALCDHVVEAQGSTEAPPKMTGGTITDGTYLLTAYTVFGAPTNGPVGLQVEMVLVINGTELLGTLASNGGTPSGYAATLDTAGGMFKADGTCPSATVDPAPDQFTATADELQILDETSALLVFTRTQ